MLRPLRADLRPIVAAILAVLALAFGAPARADIELNLNEPIYTLPKYWANTNFEVRIHTRPGFTGRGPLSLVLYFHGDDNCVNRVAYGTDCHTGRPVRGRQGFVKLFDAIPNIGTEVALVLLETNFPTGRGATGTQLPFEERQKDGFMARVLNEILPELGKRSLADVDRIVLAGHSHAFNPMCAALYKGGINAKLSSVVFLDALFLDVSSGLREWRAAHPAQAGDLRIVYSTRVSGRNTIAWSRYLAGAFGGVAVPTTDVHSEIPERHFASQVAAALAVPAASVTRAVVRQPVKRSPIPICPNSFGRPGDYPPPRR